MIVVNGQTCYNQSETASVIGISTTTLRQLIARGDFAEHISITRRPHWTLESIRNWVETRRASKRAERVA